MRPKLSIIIPTYNEEKNISKCIESLEKQSYKNFEVIIVDDGSTDKTREIVRKYKKIKLVEGQHKGTGFSRNLGAKRAGGEILVFVDADMTFHKDYLKNLIVPMTRNKNVVGTEEEAQYPTNLKNIWSLCWGQIRTDPKDKERKIFRAIWKNKFMEMEGFDPRYGYADDQTFFLKYGIKPEIARGAVCYHDNPETLKEVYKQSRWIGASGRYKWLDIPVLNLLIIFLMYPLSFVAIPILALKRCYKDNNFSIFPYMVIFMCVRYFGNLAGYLRKSILKQNIR